jgi:two-component system, NarL family, response regulator LiaR
VVIIDDESAVRQAVAWLLRVEGFEVLGESGTGTDGVALATTLEPAFVVIDNMMPGGMDGSTAAKLIRAQLPGTKIVAFSGLVDETPPWADAHLRKEHISDIAGLLERLAS